MKKSHISRIFIVLIAVSITLGAITSCSKNTDGAVSIQTAAITSSNGTQQQNRSFNREEMQKQIHVCIDFLVSDGTITKEQGDKIAEAYLSNTGRPDGQQRPRNGQQGNGQNAQNSIPPGNGQGGGQNRSRFNLLGKLVVDGTITQAQADAFMQKLRESYPRQNNDQTTGS